ncbi:MAG: hypothetical protein ABIT20_05610 [Gemmatimonadaceae bacterium]
MRALIFVSTVASLATISTPASVRAQAPDTRDSTLATVQVQNDRTVPVTVFVDRGEFDVRLGTVAPLQSATLRIPKWMSTENSDVRIYFHPEGAADLETETFAVHPGTRIGLVVPLGNLTLASNITPEPMVAALPDSDVDATTITVENPRNVAVTIYLERGDFDTRVGTVPAGRTATLRLPPTGGQWVEIFVHPEGGLDLCSASFPVKHGDHLGLEVPLH